MSDFDFLTPDFIKAHKKATGARIILQIFPWKYLGWSDTEFMANEMYFSHGPVIPDEQKRILLVYVRIEEEKLLVIHKFVTDRERVMGPAPKYTQLELF